MKQKKDSKQKQTKDSKQLSAVSSLLKIGNSVQFTQQFLELPTKLYSKPETEEFYSLIEYMLLDAQVSASFEARKAAILSIPHFFDGDEKAVDKVQYALEEIDFEKDLESALNFLVFGSYYFVVNWKLENNFFKIASIDPAHPRYFRWTPKGELYIKTPTGDHKAPPYRIIYFRRNPTPENPYGESILKACYPAWKLKYETLNQVFAYQEKYANPPLVGIKKEGDIDDESKLRKIAEDLASVKSGATAFIQGVDDIKIIQTMSGTYSFTNILNWCNEEISRAITKQTLTTNNSETGTYALGKVHQETLENIAILDAKYIARKLNITLIRWILELNDIQEKCQFKFEIPNEAELDDIFKATDKGLKVPASYLYRRLNVPEPEEGEEVITNSPTQSISLSGGKPVNFF